MENGIKLDKLNKEEALRYLGYPAEHADDATLEMMKTCEEKVLETAKVRYVYKIADITPAEQGVCVDGTDLILRGNSIKEHLTGCEKAALIAVTLSDGIDRLLRFLQTTDMASALIADSLSSVAIEQACDKVEEMIKQELPSYNQTFRFGIGYGDFPIEQQKAFLNILNAGKQIGLMTNASSMLTPTKSVTAVIGLTTGPVQAGKRGCTACNLRDICNFRKVGKHCNG